VQVSDGEVEERYRLDHEQVDLAFVRIRAADLAPSVTLGEDELQKYLADHPDAYRVPTRVRVRYVVYRPADFAGQAQVSEQEIADYYAEHRDDRFQEPEQIHSRQILIRVAPTADDDARAAARKKAEELLAKLKAGEDMAALAKKHSQDAISASKGGDLGFLARGRMPAEFDEAAFALQPGELSDVVSSASGFHLIRVEERREAGPKPIEAVRDEIAEVLRRERGLDLARKQADTDRREVVRGKALAEAVGGRKVEETPLFAASDEVPEVGRVPAFTEAAFALVAGEVSDLLESDDAVYLLTPAERVEAHVPPLDEVRERVTADARQSRGADLARERGEALRKRAQEAGLEKAAAEAGFTVEQTGTFERRAGSVPKIGPAGELRTDAFGLTPEAPLAPKVYAAGGDAVVAALHERAPADMGGFAAAKDALHESLLQQKRYALLGAYMNFLKERAQREGALEVRADALGRG
jgi:peptidyl-prolyl cis-trans isomerase D